MSKLARILILFALVALVSLTVAYAHSGGTDTVGGHHNKQTDTYHVHWENFIEIGDRLDRIEEQIKGVRSACVGGP